MIPGGIRAAKGVIPHGERVFRDHIQGPGCVGFKNWEAPRLARALGGQVPTKVYPLLVKSWLAFWYMQTPI